MKHGLNDESHWLSLKRRLTRDKSFRLVEDTETEFDVRGGHPAKASAKELLLTRSSWPNDSYGVIEKKSPGGSASAGASQTGYLIGRNILEKQSSMSGFAGGNTFLKVSETDYRHDVLTRSY